MLIVEDICNKMPILQKYLLYIENISNDKTNYFLLMLHQYWQNLSTLIFWGHIYANIYNIVQYLGTIEQDTEYNNYTGPILFYY